MKRRIPVPILIVVDILLLGVSLCVYALFHHVLPQVEAEVKPPEGGTNRPPTQIVNPIETDPPTTDPPDTDTGETNAGETANPPDTGDPGVTETTPPDSETTPPETEPPPPQGPFTNGEVISTETVYKSKDISITLTKYVEKVSSSRQVVYWVQDIYVRYVENLKTAFAKDQYGRSIAEKTPVIAARNNAIGAINGDYYGATGSTGVVIRNGVLYRDNPDEDVLVMFYDGTMKVYAKDEFDGETVMAQGAYQAWCFGPSLLDADGNPKTEFPGCKITTWNPRTAIGYIAPGHYCFVFVEGRSDESSGLKMDMLATVMKELGCTIAYNLDGGQTSVMTFGDEVVGVPYKGGRSCSDIIYIAELDQ